MKVIVEMGQTEDDRLVFGGVLAGAQLVGGRPQFFLEGERRTVHPTEGRSHETKKAHPRPNAQCATSQNLLEGQTVVKSWKNEN
jgi:hypothetical protein